MGMLLEFDGNMILDGSFHGDNILARRYARTVADPKDVGIDRLCRKLEPHVQHDIRRLAPDARQRLKGCARRRHLAAIFIHQNLAHLDDVLCFLAEQADGFDVFSQALNTQRQHLLGCIRDLEQCLGRLVHTRIRRLCRQRDSHNQRVGVHVVQFALWFRLAFAEPGKDLVDRFIVHLFCHPPFHAQPADLAQAKSATAAQGKIFCQNLHGIREARLSARGLRKKRSDRADDSVTNDAMNEEHGYHYNVMRRAIAAIDDESGRQMPLEELAAKLDMSPAHFQRIFTRWVGVSPKKYQQYLTLDHAKALLAERFTTLEAAHEAGLSGSSRLHDLFLNWEAMTPGEFARKGKGLTIRHGWFESPFGRSLVMGTDKGICGLAFSDETGDDEAMADMRARWPAATFVEDPATLAPWVGAAYGQSGEAKLHLIGAPFQIKVWEALLQIPSGHVSTYSEIAEAVGNPRAVRAVGTAVGRNPVSWLIPCHRALRKSGALGGYHWGLPVKRALLAWEGARADQGI